MSADSQVGMVHRNIVLVLPSQQHLMYTISILTTIQISYDHPTGSQFLGIAHAVRPQQRKNRNVAPFPQAQAHGRAESGFQTIPKSGSSSGLDHHVHDDTVGRGQRAHQIQALSRGSSRSRTQAQPGVRRVSHGQANSPHQEASTKVHVSCVLCFRVASSHLFLSPLYAFRQCLMHQSGLL